MKAIELFAGAGGLGLGISQAGFRPIVVAEWDLWSCENLRLNRGRGRPLKDWPNPFEGDVRSIDYKEFEGNVALVSGGPPCQPFSMGGKHQAQEDGRDMWPEAVRAVRETRPKAFVFENVKGLKRQAFATYVSYIELQLKFPRLAKKRDESWQSHLARLQKHETGRREVSEEYRVIFFSLNAADFGVPQKRERVMFVGFRADLGIRWAPPNPTHSREALLWSKCRDETYWERHQVKMSERDCSAIDIASVSRLQAKPKQKPWLTIRDAISDLPDPELEAIDRLSHKFQAGALGYTLVILEARWMSRRRH